MVKGTSRRVIVVDSPDPRIFEQAIFILRSDAPTEGVSSRQLVEQAVQVVKDYTRYQCRPRRRWLQKPLVCAILGAAAIGLAWLLVTVL